MGGSVRAPRKERELPHQLPCAVGARRRGKRAEVTENRPHICSVPLAEPEE